MFTQIVLPELASVQGLDPFDLQHADVGGNLLYFGGIRLAAISQIRKAHHSVAMDVVNPQALPVVHYPVEIAHHPNELRNMMVDGRIEPRRCCRTS